MGLFDSDFEEMMFDLDMMEHDEFINNCKKNCPNWKSCKGNISKCKDKNAKKKHGLFW